MLIHVELYLFMELYYFWTWYLIIFKLKCNPKHFALQVNQSITILESELRTIFTINLAFSFITGGMTIHSTMVCVVLRGMSKGYLQRLRFEPAAAS